jgi:arylsulfatase A-like enzyme
MIKMTTRFTLPRFFLIVAVLCGSFACAENKPPNFLILIGDDMGVETIPCYPVGSAPAKTPHISELCANGMRFDNFWSQPVCSPTRATILTGQFGFRNGVGTPANGPSIDYPIPELPAGSAEEARDPDLPPGAGGPGMGGGMGGGMGANSVPEEDRDDPLNQRPSISKDAYGLPAALGADESLDYQSVALGKWHLASETNGGLEHPMIVGFDNYIGNFNGGAVESYFAWSKVVDGEITDGQTGYATTETVNDALSWLAESDADKPWLMWVAFNAPHSPYAPPPAELLSEETAAALEGAEGHQVFTAMIEAMDTEIGRLLSEIPEEELANTYVIFLGDNGSPGAMATPPFPGDRAKGQVYQGGVNVPLVITGPGVESGVSTDALANSVDLFATLLDLAGTADDARLDEVVIDGVSLAPVLTDPSADVRSFAYADVFGPQQGQIVNRKAIRDERYKIIRDLRNETEEFYDLSVDPFEQNDLLQGELDDDAQRGYDSLEAQLEELLSSR